MRGRERGRERERLNTEFSAWKKQLTFVQKILHALKQRYLKCFHSTPGGCINSIQWGSRLKGPWHTAQYTTKEWEGESYGPWRSQWWCR